MKTQIDNTFSYERLNYSMVWEDPKILYSCLPKAKNNLHILSIGSAGDNALYLLQHKNTKVTAIDLNLAQFNLIKLKKSCFEFLSHKDFLFLFGYLSSNPENRLSIFEKIKNKLDSDTLLFWEKHLFHIENGLIHQGRLETYFNKFLNDGLKSIFSDEDLNFILKNNSIQKQQQFFEKHNKDLSSFTNKFFNRESFSNEGRSDAHYKHVDQSITIEHEIFTRTIKRLKTELIKNNPYLYYVFSGTFSEENLPDYLKLETFNKIKNNIHNLQIVKSDLESFLTQGCNEKFDFFNLSDIFEYVSTSHFKNLLSLIKKQATTNARLAYWSLFVNRELEDHLSWKKNKVLSSQLQKEDRVWFYQSFNVLEVK